MKFTEAMAAIAKIYEPGCIEWYAKQPVDEWAQMVDRLEQAIQTKDLKLMESASIQYLNQAKKLIGHYKAMGVPRKQLSLGDAFMMGAEPGCFEAALSVDTDSCYRCESKAGLEVEMIPGDNYAVRVICEACIKLRHELARQKENSELRDKKKIVRSSFVGQSQKNRRF